MKDPLNPPPRLLRAIARALVENPTDPRVREWAEQIRALPKPTQARKFPGTSIVATYRARRLCGFEVWRHLGGSRDNPARTKARLWFGIHKLRSQLSAKRAAYKAAAILSRMSESELREWWDEYRRARTEGRPASNLWRNVPRFEDGLDHTDRRNLFAAYRRAS